MLAHDQPSSNLYTGESVSMECYKKGQPVVGFAEQSPYSATKQVSDTDRLKAYSNSVVVIDKLLKQFSTNSLGSDAV